MLSTTRTAWTPALRHLINGSLARSRQHPGTDGVLTPTADRGQHVAALVHGFRDQCDGMKLAKEVNVIPADLVLRYVPASTVWCVRVCVAAMGRGHC